MYRTILLILSLSLILVISLTAFGAPQPPQIEANKVFVQVSFDELSEAYFMGDTINIKLTTKPGNKGLRADLYVMAWDPQNQSAVFINNNSTNPLSFKPVKFKADFPVIIETLQILKMSLPAMEQGLKLQLFAALFETGTSFDVENLLSNIARTQIKLMGTAQNVSERNQAAVLRLLKNASNPEVFESQVSQGSLRWMNLNLGLPKSMFPSGAKTDDVALALLSTSEQFLRVMNPRKNLRLIKRAGDALQTLTFRQYYQDIPVRGSWFQMVIEETDKQFILHSLSGRYTPDLSFKTIQPLVSEQIARHKVRSKFGYKSLSELRTFVPVKLWIYDDALLAAECPNCQKVAHNPVLTWRVTFNDTNNGGVLTDALVDANTGKMLSSRSRYDDVDMRIWTADGNILSTCMDHNDARAWLDENGVCESKNDCDRNNICSWDLPYTCPTPDLEGYTALDYTRETHDFYNFFGRDTYDDHGSIYRMYLDVDFTNGPNAMSEQCGAYEVHKFSDGWADIDVIGHEIGHSFHWSEVTYERTHQSGAIKEHIADMFGHFLGYWSGIDPDWQNGEDTPRGTIRDLQNPAHDHISDYVWVPESDDDGGVHRYSTIPSKAAYLFTAGDTHNSIKVDGIGEAKSRQIYYKLVTDKLADNDSFEDFARKIREKCNEMIGEYSISSNDCCQVRNAFAAVGLGVADSDCDGTLNTDEVDDDSDGINDLLDNCQFIPNPAQGDIDHDGIGDACDNDIDNDGHFNAADNCPNVANAGQLDRNADGEGDACDDSDNDNTVDSLDNCPDRYNRDQIDSDGDGQGNECDNDMDGDGLNNSSDNCPQNANGNQADGDGDGVGNICDNCPDDSNPAMSSGEQPDLDDDGQGDACDNDIDGDGVVNSDDACQEEAGNNSEFCIAPEGEFCRGRGCPNGRLIPEAEVNMHFNWGHLDEAHPAFLQPMGKVFFDPCDIIRCDEQTLFDENDTLQITLDMSLSLPLINQMEAPIAFNLAIVDERGNLMAARETHFITAKNQINLSQQLDDQVVLSFQMPAAFSWKHLDKVTTVKAASRSQTVNANTNAALPAFYLIIEPWSLTEENRKLLSATPLKLKAGIKLIKQEK